MVEQSESIASLAAALVGAQAEFEPVDKTATNPFFKAKYADLPTIVRAVQPILAKHKLAIVQMPGMDEGADTLTTRLMHSSGEWIQSTMRLHLAATGSGGITPQVQGSALTYARRYGLSAILGIVTDEDDDGAHSSQVQKSQQTASKPKVDAQTISDAQRRRMFAIAKDRGITEEHLRQIVVGVTGDSSTTSVTRDNYETIVEMIENGEVPKSDRVVQNVEAMLARGSYDHPDAP